MRFVLHSKIHNATVTESDLDYVGSIAIDEDLLDRAKLWLGEKVLVASLTSGNRLETYIIPGKRGSGEIAINGAASHLIKKGEKVIIMAFQLSDKPIQPTVILVDDQNAFSRILS